MIVMTDSAGRDMNIFCTDLNALLSYQQNNNLWEVSKKNIQKIFSTIIRERRIPALQVCVYEHLRLTKCLGDYSEGEDVSLISTKTYTQHFPWTHSMLGFLVWHRTIWGICTLYQLCYQDYVCVCLSDVMESVRVQSSGSQLVGCD